MVKYLYRISGCQVMASQLGTRQKLMSTWGLPTLICCHGNINVDKHQLSFVICIDKCGVGTPGLM